MKEFAEIHMEPTACGVNAYVLHLGGYRAGAVDSPLSVNIANAAHRADLKAELKAFLGEVIKVLQSVESDACAMGEFIQADCVNLANGKVRSIDIDAFLDREDANGL